MFKQMNYKTAIVGKWHLGLGSGKINYNSKISPGPNEIGFDYSYIMPDTQDRVPTVYLEDGYVKNLDKKDPLFVDFEITLITNLQENQIQNYLPLYGTMDILIQLSMEFQESDL